MKKTTKTVQLGGRTLTLSSGVLAEQADAAILAQYGDTVVLATVVASTPLEDKGYFPLSVEYQERLYAGGRIKGSRWVKREGRPTDEEILVGRLIDRSIRPLFPKEYNRDVQVIVTVLSVDIENDPADVALLAVSAALLASPIPWNGPVASLRVGMAKEGGYLINPTDDQMKLSILDLVVSYTKDAIVMIEAGANEVSKKDLLGAIAFGKEQSSEILGFIEDFAKEVGIADGVVEKKEVNTKLEKEVRKLAEKSLGKIVTQMADKSQKEVLYEEMKQTILEKVGEEDAPEALAIFENLLKYHIREMILKGKRPDGRKLDQIRELSSEVGVLPRTHGSAIFKRGATQVLTVVTLGSPSMGQLLESAEGEAEKRYMHHYSMPPYATGETGRVGSPGRREIGHGALAERALVAVLPSADEFPYAIRLVSEVMSSNGSTSMGSTCGSTLALMDAGVPLKAPVSGIAMGLIIESEKKFAVLTDIAGIEDFNGDMDFKVAGTKNGITALQLDVKTTNLTYSILESALEDAEKGRAFILESMLKTISGPREKVSTYAPKITSIKINPEKIGEVIGPGGKTIKGIIASTGAEVDVEDDGTVSITAIDGEAMQKAVDMVEALTKEVIPGEIYEGEVKRLQNFGAFVEILPGKDGLVHVSDMSEGYVKSPEDVVSIGQKVTVRVKEIDNMGRLNLSMVLDPAKEREREERPRGGGDRSGGDRGGRRFDRRPRGGGDRSGGDRGGRKPRSTGPQFPTSRLVSDKGNKRYR